MIRSRICLASLLAILFFVVNYSVGRHTVRGTVHSEGRPVSGARVGFQGEWRRVTTGAAGDFQLQHRPGDSRRLTASKDGYVIGGADAHFGHEIHIQLRALPGSDASVGQVDYEWIDPNPDQNSEFNCANCHTETYRQWVASSHATAAINPRFWALFDRGTNSRQIDDANATESWSFIHDHSDARGVCRACHIPTARVTESAAVNPDKLHGVMAEGVHCDLCHKVTDVSSHAGVTHGSDGLKLFVPEPGEQAFLGPWDDVDRGRDSYAELFRSSRYCASCHEGVLFGTRVYTTYSEWKNSEYSGKGIECQNCHMHSVSRKGTVAHADGGIERRLRAVSDHSMKTGRPLSDVIQLFTNARRRSDGVINLEVRLESRDIGHAFPTGFPQRHLVLVVGAEEEQGALVQVAGTRVPQAVVGSSASVMSGTAGAMLGRYLAPTGGEGPAPFWQAVEERFDTRLFPGRPSIHHFGFQSTDGSSVRLRVQLFYRRFYPEVELLNGWEPTIQNIGERLLEVPSH